MPGKVPGDLITDLQAAALVGDPLYELNFKNARCPVLNHEFCCGRVRPIKWWRVLPFLNITFTRGVLLGFTMLCHLCDVISAVTGFMVRVLHSRSAFGIHDVAGIEFPPCV
jgi:hypothetical protein